MALWQLYKLLLYGVSHFRRVFAHQNWTVALSGEGKLCSPFLPTSVFQWRKQQFSTEGLFIIWNTNPHYTKFVQQLPVHCSAVDLERDKRRGGRRVVRPCLGGQAPFSCTLDWWLVLQKHLSLPRCLELGWSSGPHSPCGWEQQATWFLQALLSVWSCPFHGILKQGWGNRFYIKHGVVTLTLMWLMHEASIFTYPEMDILQLFHSRLQIHKSYHPVPSSSTLVCAFGCLSFFMVHLLVRNCSFSLCVNGVSYSSSPGPVVNLCCSSVVCVCLRTAFGSRPEPVGCSF